MMDYYNSRDQVTIRQREIQERAKRYRFIQSAQGSRKVIISRFYHVALAQFGRWMVMSGNRLQRRYGQLTEFSHPIQKPMSSERRVY